MEVFNCMACGAENQNKRNHVNKYCDNKCQQVYQIRQRNILVEANQALNSAWVKKYLIEKHGNVCMDPDCCWDQSKRTVVVELEHKDGNSDNNTLDNCILLCPNCHSLTPTYKNKNAGNGRAYRRKRYAEGKSY